MSSTLIDPRAARTKPRPSPLVFSARWTLSGWCEGDHYVFHPTLAPNVTPDATLFMQLVADECARVNGERVEGDLPVRHVVAIPGIHRVITVGEACSNTRRRIATATDAELDRVLADVVE